MGGPWTPPVVPVKVLDYHRGGSFIDVRLAAERLLKEETNTGCGLTTAPFPLNLTGQPALCFP